MCLGDRMHADSYEYDVTCKNCGKVYHQRVDDQVAGFRDMRRDKYEDYRYEF